MCMEDIRIMRETIPYRIYRNVPVPGSLPGLIIPPNPNRIALYFSVSTTTYVDLFIWDGNDSNANVIASPVVGSFNGGTALVQDKNSIMTLADYGQLIIGALYLTRGFSGSGIYVTELTLQKR